MQILSAALATALLQAASAAEPARKRSQIRHKSAAPAKAETFDPYLGLEAKRGLAGHVGGSSISMSTSMSMAEIATGGSSMAEIALGSNYCTWSPDTTCYESGLPKCCGKKDGKDCPDVQPECEIATTTTTTTTFTTTTTTTEAPIPATLPATESMSMTTTAATESMSMTTTAATESMSMTTTAATESMSMSMTTTVATDAMSMTTTMATEPMSMSMATTAAPPAATTEAPPTTVAPVVTTEAPPITTEAPIDSVVEDPEPSAAFSVSAFGVISAVCVGLASAAAW